MATQPGSPSSPLRNTTLECGLKIIPSSTARHAPVTAKKAVLTLSRDARRRILLCVVVGGSRPFSASYLLSNCTIHTRLVSSGKGSIEIRSSGITLHICNAPPRTLNIFLRGLEAKLELLAAEGGLQKTPVHVARALLVAGLPRISTELSPLTITEMRKVRRLRGLKSPCAPSGCPSSQETPAASGSLRKDLRSLISKPLTSLSQEQRRVLRAVIEEGVSVFFTGAAGTGKSLLLNAIIQRLPADTTQVTAATGVAACQLGGTTLHSFAGVGHSSTLEEAIRVITANKASLKRWRELTHLVVDEISMIHAEFFTLLELVAREVRGRQQPFGGVQLVLTGDFLQLPPVCQRGQEPVFCFESSSWRESIQRTMLLKEVRRQEDDDGFIRILQQVRMGRCDAMSEKLLRGTMKNETGGPLCTRLCTHSDDAQLINDSSLEELPGEIHIFKSEDVGFGVDREMKAAVPPILHLKQGAQVMLTKNVNIAAGLSNGARGIIDSFAPSGFPLVKFHSIPGSGLIEIRPTRFTIRSCGGGEVRWRQQLPLQLAWAISIHKSQGLTLDSVEVSLARVFAPGQTYVALSRARSLSSLSVLDFDLSSVVANSKVVAYYESLEKEVNDEPFVLAKRRRTE